MSSAHPATFALPGRGKPAREGMSRLLRGMRRWRTFTLGMFIVLTFVGVAVLAPVLAPFDPAKPDAVSSWHWPESPRSSVVKPDGT